MLVEHCVQSFLQFKETKKEHTHWW